MEISRVECGISIVRELSSALSAGEFFYIKDFLYKTENEQLRIENGELRIENEELKLKNKKTK